MAVGGPLPFGVGVPGGGVGVGGLAGGAIPAAFGGFAGGAAMPPGFAGLGGAGLAGILFGGGAGQNNDAAGNDNQIEVGLMDVPVNEEQAQAMQAAMEEANNAGGGVAGMALPVEMQQALQEAVQNAFNQAAAGGAGGGMFGGGGPGGPAGAFQGAFQNAFGQFGAGGQGPGNVMEAIQNAIGQFMTGAGGGGGGGAGGAGGGEGAGPNAANTALPGSDWGMMSDDAAALGGNLASEQGTAGDDFDDEDMDEEGDEDMWGPGAFFEGGNPNNEMEEEEDEEEEEEEEEEENEEEEAGNGEGSEIEEEGGGDAEMDEHGAQFSPTLSGHGAHDAQVVHSPLQESSTNSLRRRDPSPKQRIHVGFCSHAIHLKCWERMNRARSRPPMGEDFPCPLCKSLSNALVPVPGKLVKKPSSEASQNEGNQAFQNEGNPSAQVTRTWNPSLLNTLKDLLQVQKVDSNEPKEEEECSTTCMKLLVSATQIPSSLEGSLDVVAGVAYSLALRVSTSIRDDKTQRFLVERVQEVRSLWKLAQAAWLLDARVEEGIAHGKIEVAQVLRASITSGRVDSSQAFSSSPLPATGKNAATTSSSAPTLAGTSPSMTSKAKRQRTLPDTVATWISSSHSSRAIFDAHPFELFVLMGTLIPNMDSLTLCAQTCVAIALVKDIYALKPVQGAHVKRMGGLVWDLCVSLREDVATAASVTAMLGGEGGMADFSQDSLLPGLRRCLTLLVATLFSLKEKHLAERTLPDLKYASLQELWGWLDMPGFLSASHGFQEQQQHQKLENVMEVENVYKEFCAWAKTWPLPTFASPAQSLVRWPLDFPVEGEGLARRFVELPEKFEDLFVQLALGKVHCPTRGPNIPVPSPGICLLCGDVVCAGSECCRRGRMGAAHQHAAQCAGGIGVFLLASRAQVYLCRGRIGALFPAPYVDSAGEPDPRLVRGRPLHLETNKLDALMRLVVDLRIPQEVSSARASSAQPLPEMFF